MHYIFVDTNFFIHYNSYDKINWDKLFPDDICIVIPRQVLSELDNHKNSNNLRKRNRARAVIPLIRNLRESPKTTSINGNNVTISLINRFETTTPRKSFLDLNKPDDRIANEVLSWVEQNPDTSYCVVTGDIGLLTTCDDCGIPCHELLEEWMLLPEPDEREKKISILEKQVALLSSNKPNLVINLYEEICAVTIERFDELCQQDIMNFINMLCEYIPKKEDFTNELQPDKDHKDIERFVSAAHITLMGAGHRKLVIPTRDDINKYHQQYDSWKNNCCSVLKTSHEAIKNAASTFKASFELENNGNAPAEDVLVRIQTFGGVLLMPQGEDDASLPWGHVSLNLPKAPEPPKREYIDFAPKITPHRLFDALRPILPPHTPPPKKVDTFYWEPSSPNVPVDTWEYSCIEFRHQLSPKLFDLDLLIPESGIGKDLKIEVSVYARQLPKPILKTIGIRPHYIQGNIVERIARDIQNYISKNSKQSMNMYNSLLQEYPFLRK